MPVTKKLVKAKLDKRLITEVTRFFGGWETMLQEIMQNVYRSKASRLDVTFNAEDGAIEFSDDGIGCADPQKLLSAGATGWDEKKVKAPAGLGFFSLFDPSIVSNVVIESSSWRMIIPPEIVTTGSFEVTRLSRRRKGFKIRLQLNDDFLREGVKGTFSRLTQSQLEDQLSTVLTTYPFQLYFNGKRITNCEAKQLTHAVKLISSTWGTMYLLPVSGSAHCSRKLQVIWEHRLMSGMDVLRRVFKHAAEGNKFQQWIVSTTNLYDESLRLVWKINTSCGVEPKLPDRNDLIDNGHLSKAATAWLQIIEQWFDDGRHKTWSDVIRKTSELGVKVDRIRDAESIHKTEHIIRNNAIEPLLRKHGWEPHRGENINQLEIERLDQNSVNIRQHNLPTTWIKTDIAGGVPVSSHDFMVLRNQDTELLTHRDAMPVIAEQPDEDNEDIVRIELDWDPPFNPEQVAASQTTFIGVARSIRWNGRELPFHLFDEEDQTRYGCAAVIAGTVEEVASILEISFCDYVDRDADKQKTFDLVTNWLLTTADQGDLFGGSLSEFEWEDTDGDEATIAYSKMYADIRDQFYETYTPEKLEINKKLVAFSTLLDVVSDARTKLDSVVYSAQHSPSKQRHQEASALLSSLDAFKDAVETDVDRLRKILQQSFPLTKEPA